MEKNSNVSISSVMEVANAVPLKQILEVAQKVDKTLPFPPVSTAIILLLKILVGLQDVLSDTFAQCKHDNVSATSEDLSKAIMDAFKDGKLSSDEKVDIMQKANSLGLDIDNLMSNLKELESITEQAVADGVLSPEETQSLSEQASKCEIDTKDFIEQTKKLVK